MQKSKPSEAKAGENSRGSSQALSIVPAAPRVYLLKWPRLAASPRNNSAHWPAETLVQHAERSQITACLTTGHFEQTRTLKRGNQEIKIPTSLRSKPHSMFPSSLSYINLRLSLSLSLSLSLFLKKINNQLWQTTLASQVWTIQSLNSSWGKRPHPI